MGRAARQGLRYAVGGLSLALLMAALVWGVGRGGLAWLARQQAAAELRQGAISAAHAWLAWSQGLTSSDGEADLLAAVCFRQLQDVERFVEALEQAERKGIALARIEHQRRLGLIQAGRIEPSDQGQIGEWIAAGLPANDVAAAFVYGFLARGQADEARRVLAAWEADLPDDAHLAFMKGLFWQFQDDPGQAERELRMALARQPRHELAHRALAELLEQQDRLDRAFEQYLEMAQRLPESKTPIAGMARMLRKLGRWDAAREVLRWANEGIWKSADVIAEAAQIDLDSGDLRSAIDRFGSAGLDQTKDRALLRSAATAFALDKQGALALRWLGLADEGYRRSRRIYELRARLAVDPGDKAIAEELHRLSRELLAPRSGPAMTSTGEEPGKRPSSDPKGDALASYAMHCSSCHGETGHGDGPAARQLFPRARDLCHDAFRLVSTVNAVPRIEDVEAVIRRGIPGTAMQPLETLTEAERWLLAEEVLRFAREGAQAQLAAMMVREEGEIDEAELRRLVDLRSKPGPVVTAPPIGRADAACLARGKEAFLQLGCPNCHGTDGAGRSLTPLWDDQGVASAPRNLVHDPFKGGHEPEAIYFRIRLGMPGTAHPSCPTVSDHDLMAVVHFCRAISKEPKRSLTNHERFLEACAQVETTPSSPHAASPTSVP